MKAALTATSRRLLQTALLVVLGLSLSQASLDCARADDRFRISLEDELGAPLRTFHHRGTTYVLGHEYQRYNVRAENRTGERVEVVLTVDGRDVISGREGDYRHERGYLLPPYGSVLIEGFRTSFDGVAAFRFASPEDSYSARMGTPENVGIVGAAFFPEARRPRPAPIAREERKKAPSPRRRAHGSGAGAARGADGRSRERESAPSSDSAARSGTSEAYTKHDDASRLGTEYGEHQDSHAVEVPFQRASSRPAAVITLRYDDARGLERRGIRLRRPAPRPAPRGPEAFPLSRFAPPPL